MCLIERHTYMNRYVRSDKGDSLDSEFAVSVKKNHYLYIILIRGVLFLNNCKPLSSPLSVFPFPIWRPSTSGASTQSSIWAADTSCALLLIPVALRKRPTKGRLAFISSSFSFFRLQDYGDKRQDWQYHLSTPITNRWRLKFPTKPLLKSRRRLLCPRREDFALVNCYTLSFQLTPKFFYTNCFLRVKKYLNFHFIYEIKLL